MERITLIGYLGSDARVVSIDGEEKFFQTSLAPIRSKKKEGDKTLLWYQLNFPLGLQKLVPYLKKGGLVAVVGSPRITAYLDKTNTPVPTCVIYVDQVELLGRKEETNTQPFSDTSVSSSTATDQPQDFSLPY